MNCINITRYRVIRVALFVSVAVLTLSCSVESEFSISADGTGSGRAVIRMHAVVSAYIDELMMSFGDTSGTSMALFDAAAIRSALTGREGIKPIHIELLDPRTLVIEFEILDFEAALGGIVELGSIGRTGATRLELELDRESFLGISQLFFPLDSPAAVFVPVTMGDFLSAAEYEELLSYALDGLISGITTKEVIESSTIGVVVEPDGEITEVDGGSVTEDSAVFLFPMIDTVTLENAIRAALEWR